MFDFEDLEVSAPRVKISPNAGSFAPKAANATGGPTATRRSQSAEREELLARLKRGAIDEEPDPVADVGGLAAAVEAARLDEAQRVITVSGARVRFHNLVSRSDLNGTTGTLVSYDDRNGRWECLLQDGEGTVNVRPANFEVFSPEEVPDMESARESDTIEELIERMRLASIEDDKAAEAWRQEHGTDAGTDVGVDDERQTSTPETTIETTPHIGPEAFSVPNPRRGDDRKHTVQRQGHWPEAEQAIGDGYEAPRARAWGCLAQYQMEETSTGLEANSTQDASVRSASEAELRADPSLPVDPSSGNGGQNDARSSAGSSADRVSRELENAAQTQWAVLREWDPCTVLFELQTPSGVSVLPMHLEHEVTLPAEVSQIWLHWGVAYATQIRFGATPEFEAATGQRWLNPREDPLPPVPNVTPLKGKASILEAVRLALEARDAEAQVRVSKVAEKRRKTYRGDVFHWGAPGKRSDPGISLFEPPLCLRTEP